MDPNLFLLPRLRGDSDSGRDTGSEDSQSLRDGELHDSVQQVKKTLSLYQSQFPMDDPRFHTHLSSLVQSSLSTFQSLLQDALHQPAHQLLLVLEKAMAPLPAQVLPAERCDLYNSLSFVCRKRGKFDLAQKYGMKALEITKNFDASDIDRAGTHLNLCSLLSSQGRFKDAVRHAKQSVEFLQEDLVTMKLTHRTDDLTEKVRHLAVGYQHVAAGLEAMGINREASVWYGKAIRLASESQDTEIRKMIPTLQAAMSLAKSHGENETSTSSPGHRYPELSFSSQGSSKSSSIYLSSKRSPHSGMSSAEFRSENYSANLVAEAQVLDSEDEDLRTLGSMGALEFEEEEAHRQPKLRMPAADIKSQSDMRLFLHSGESSPLVRTFLWKRDMSDSERSDFPRHSLNRALARLPRLLKATDQSLSSKSSKSPSSSKHSLTRPSKSHFPTPASPMRFRRFRTESNASVASSRSSMQTLNIVTRKTEEWREGLVIAVKIGLARRKLKERLIQRVEIQVVPLPVPVQVKVIDERLAAIKIQTAFRRFRAKTRLNAVQKWVKNREIRKLVHRIGRKFGEQLGIVSIYEKRNAEIEFIAVINAEEYRLSVQTKAISDLQSMINDLEIEGRGKLRLKGPIIAQKPPMILADFSLLYQRLRYKVTIYRANQIVDIEVLPQSAKLRGKKYSVEEFTPIFPQSLSLSLEVDSNNLQLRRIQPVFVLEQKDPGLFFTDLRVYDRGDWLEFQLTLQHREVALLGIERSTDFSVTEWKNADFLEVVKNLRLDKSGFPELIRPQLATNEQDSIQTIQTVIRRLLAWKVYQFLKSRHRRVPSSKQILKRSITLGRCALVITATLQSSGAIVFAAVNQSDKRESKLELTPQIWKQYGSTDDSAAMALLSELRYRDGALSLGEEEKKNNEKAVKVIQKWARGMLGRRRARTLLLQKEWKMEVCRLQEHGGTRRHAAVYSSSTSLKLELFPTLKFTPQKEKSLILLLSLEEIQRLYQNIPSYLTICDDLQVQGNKLSLQPQVVVKEVRDGPTFIMTTPKKTESGTTLVNVYLHEGELLEFSSDSSPSLSTRASLSQLSTHCHVPSSQVFVLSLTAVRYLLEVRKDRLFLSFLSPVPNLSLLITKNQALVRGVLERQRRNTTVRFCNYGLVACAKRELTGKKYAVYAYFKDSQYKLEAVRKYPRERLKLFLDPSAFRQFGPKINRKKVFEDLVFPKLFVQVKDDCSRLCLDPIFNLLQCDPTGYIRHTADPKSVSPILRRRLKESGVRVQQTPSEEVTVSPATGRKSARETQSVVSPDSARPKFSTVSEISVTANAVEESPIPAAWDTQREVKTVVAETTKHTESISVQTVDSAEKPHMDSDPAISQPLKQPGSREQTPSIERVSSVAIAPRSVPPVLVVESSRQTAVQQSVFHLRTEESERLVNRSLVASSEPRSPASQPRSPRSPVRDTQFIGMQHTSVPVSSVRFGEEGDDRSRDLVLKVGVDCTAGFFTVSMHVEGAIVTVEAVGEEKAEIACPLPSLDLEGIDSYCNSLLASLDVVSSDSGVFLLINGQSATGKLLCTSQQVISSRVYTVSVSSENQRLCVRAFDEEARRTLELTLGRRTRKMESISQEELRTLMERLKIQVVLGREVLLLDAA